MSNHKAGFDTLVQMYRHKKALAGVTAADFTGPPRRLFEVFDCLLTETNTIDDDEVEARVEDVGLFSLVRNKAIRQVWAEQKGAR